MQEMCKPTGWAQRCTKPHLTGVCAESYMCQLTGIQYTHELWYVVFLGFDGVNLSEFN